MDGLHVGCHHGCAMNCPACNHTLDEHERLGCMHSDGPDTTCECMLDYKSATISAQEKQIKELKEALYNLFQACSNLTIEDMDLLEKEINQAAAVLGDNP